MKYTYLEKEPESLVLHLKRFNHESTNNHMQRNKLSHIVKFPCGKLKFTKIFNDGSGMRNMQGVRQKSYTLQAVVQHRSSELNRVSAECGHYVTYCKDEKEEDWYLYDDSKVSRIPADRKKDEIINGNSYLLFYRLREEEDRKDASHASSSSNNTALSSNNTVTFNSFNNFN